MEKDHYNTPTSPSNAAGMFRKRLTKNDRPFDTVAKKHVNHVIDCTEKDVWLHETDKKGQIKSGIVVDSLNLVDEGMKLRFLQSQGLLDKVPTISKDEVCFWLKFLKNDVETLTQMGGAYVKLVWDTIITHYTVELQRRRYEEVYSVSDDPHDWWKARCMSHKHLWFDETTFPQEFVSEEELQEIVEKVSSVANYSRIVMNR
jgi:hypothetical protein